MVILRFPNKQEDRRALSFLAGRFPFKSWANGEMMLPESALPYLAMEGISFQVEGRATYDRLASLRNPASVAV